MKIFLFASLLSLLGTCANKRHSERIQDVKDAVHFTDTELIQQYSNSITIKDLKDYVYTISSEEHQGRRTGEVGHHLACKYLKDFYIENQIASPLGGDSYFQHIPEAYFMDKLKGSQNVLAFIEGSEFPEEVLIISAHSDHLGIVDGMVNYGADDNASGTSAVMEIAQAFQLAKADGHGPKRSVLFLHLTGEEEGLYGSRYYIDNPVFNFQNTVANLNIDMIGRVDRRHEDNPNYIYVIGADRLSTELHYISEKANEEFTHLELDYKYNEENEPNRYYYRSDHYNFALQGIPIIFYFNGEHDDYHQPTDTADKINFPILAKRTQLIFSTAWYLANNEKRLDNLKI